MKLANTVSARSLWYFPTEDLNPKGLDLIPIFVGIKARYQFQVFPSKPEDIYNAPNGIEYAKGTFRVEGKQQIAIMKFTIFNDGLVAETRFSTSATDAFLADILSFVSTQGLTFDPQIIRAKEYLSELVVTSDIDLNELNPGLRKLSAMLSETAGHNLEFAASAIHLGSDPTLPQGSRRFVFERRAGHAFNEKRYYSSAPVSTEQHMRFLEEFESVIRKT